MKKVNLNHILFFLFSLCSLDLIGQGSTPNICRNPIPYGVQTSEDWRIDETKYGTKLIVHCSTNVSEVYNCHGFARSYFELNCQGPSWNNSNQMLAYNCSNHFGNIGPTYRTDPNYLQVCSLAASDIIYYDFDGAGTHSAIKEIIDQQGNIKLLSKFGTDGPLVGHDENSTFYQLTGDSENSPREYWRYLGNENIVGNYLLSGTSPQSYSFPSITGATYSWSISSISSAGSAYISGGQNTNTVSITPTHSGTIRLNLTLDTNCGSPKTKTLLINIQTNICLEGQYSINGGSEKNLLTANSVPIGPINVSAACPNSYYLIWQKTSGSVNFSTTYGPAANFTMTSGGSLSLKISATGTSNSRTVTFYNYGSFSLSPNPSSTEMHIDLNPELEFQVTITSLENEDKLDITKYRGRDKIDIRRLQKGNYAVAIKHNDNLIARKKLIIGKE